MPNLTYTPSSGYTGNDSFTFTVSDGKDTCEATITITVGECVVNARIRGNAIHLLLLRVDFDNVLNYADLMFLVDSTLKNETGNPTYANVEKFVVLNCDFGPSLSHSVYGGLQEMADLQKIYW